jgi:hypothetical protein
MEAMVAARGAHALLDWYPSCRPVEAAAQQSDASINFSGHPTAPPMVIPSAPPATLPGLGLTVTAPAELRSAQRFGAVSAAAVPGLQAWPGLHCLSAGQRREEGDHAVLDSAIVVVLVSCFATLHLCSLFSQSRCATGPPQCLCVIRHAWLTYDHGLVPLNLLVCSLPACVGPRLVIQLR